MLQDLFAIEAERRDVDSIFLKARAFALQLNQLAFAVGSPIGRVVEEQQQSVQPAEGLESLRLAVVVNDFEIRRFFAHFGTGGNLRRRGLGRGLVWSLSERHSDTGPHGAYDRGSLYPA